MNIDTIFFLNMVATVAEKLPGTELSSSYGTPAFKVKKKLYARLKEDGTTLVVYTNEREKWMKKKPATFFITDHYKDWPLMLIDLKSVGKKDLKHLIEASWKIRGGK